MTNVYFNLIQREEMARNLWVYLCTQQGVKSAKSMSAGSEAEGRKTEGRASNEHPFSIHSASIQHPLQSGDNHVAMLFRSVRYAVMIVCMLMLCVGQMWGTEELANINFKAWTPQNISAGSTVNGCYFKSATTISAAKGATFGGNATTSSNWVAIPLSGINGSITITLTHASSRPQWKNYFKGLNAAPSSSDLSSNPSSVGDNTRPGSNTTTSSWTINTDKLYGVFYVGKGSNGLNDIYTITITTPDWTYYYRGADNDWGADAMTKSSEGFYSYKSSSTNDHQFKIAKSTSTWDYNHSFVDAGYLGTSITTIGDYGSDNCYIWSAPASYYIIVFRPGSAMNTTANPKICASATLPAEKFTISFNSSGGTGSMSSISNVVYGSEKATTANTFTKSGYRFTGWNANVDVKVGGATKTAGTLLDDEVTIQDIKTDITLTAQWEVDDGCNKIFWFAKAADATTNGVTNNTTTFSNVDAGSTGVSGSITIDGKTYSVTGRGNNNGTAITFTVPANKVGTLYGLANSSGSSARTLTLTGPNAYSATQTTSASSSSAGAFTFTELAAGNYSMAWSGNGAECMLCLKLCDAAAPSCSATQPGTITKGTLSACTLRLTAGGSAASNNTWYWQSASDGTATNLGSGVYKDVTSTGTYYIRSYCSDGSGCWSAAQSYEVTASDLTPAAPTALAKSSETAKGVTLTVTDTPNTNDYEFYVSTNSTAPTSGTSASYTSTSKSITITDKYAGTTFYAWARAKCGSYKSGWTALTGNTFTTSTVTVTHTLTNVTATSGATGANAAGGSDYTAVFAAVSGYSLPAPAITIDGNAAESGTDYTWTQGTGTVVIPANKITGDIVITIASAAAAPSSVAIGDNWLWFAGETMTLTATPTGGNGPVTYQWYKGGKADGNAIDGATNATFSKTCVFEDAGSYYCKVTCGGTQSTWGQNGDAYEVKVPRLYVKTGRNDGVKSDYGNVDFTRVDASTATASISLGANWDYCFNIADGCGHYYGNAGTMQYNSYGPWVTNVNNQDCGLRTTNGATYVFTINYSNWSQLTTTVTFPSSNQAADKVIYFDNSERQWTNVYYRIGHTSHVQASAMDKVYGTANLYTFTTTEYNNFMGWHITNATGETGSNKNIYNTANSPAISEATAHEGGAVTQSAVTVTPTTSRGNGSDTGINDNCEFFNYDITSGMKTDNVAITAPSNGTITVAYTDVNNAAQSFTSGNRDLAHTVILTSVTATPATGYDLSSLTINGNAHTSGNSYTCSGATTIAASFTLKQTTITINANTANHGSTTPGSVTATYGSALPSFTAAAGVSGYSLTGYYTDATSGTKIINADGTLVASTSYADGSSHWNSEVATLTLYAQYEEEGCTPTTASITFNNNVAGKYNTNWGVGDITTSGGATYTLTNTSCDTGHPMTKPAIKGTKNKTLIQINIPAGATSGTISVSAATYSGGAATIAITNSGGTVLASQSLASTTTNADAGSWSAPTLKTASYNITSGGTYYIKETSDKNNVYIYAFSATGTIPCCSTPTAPTAFAAGSITSTGATFTITDAGDAASYDIYYSTSSTDPTASAAATVTSDSKTKEVTGLTASTTYYAWVRSVCDADHKSDWVALTGSSFTTSAAAALNDGCWDPANTAADKLTSGDVTLMAFDNNFSDVAGITSVTIESKGTGSSGQCSGADETTPSGYMKVKDASSSGVKIITIVTSAAKDITIGGQNYNSNTGSFYLVKSTAESTKLAECNTGATSKATNCPAGTYYVYAKASTKSINFSLLCIEDAAPDVTAPTFVSSVPANGATDVATSGTIVLTFNEALGTVDPSKFTLTGATKGAVAIDGSDATKVNIAYSGAANEATVTLATAAAAVSDLAGNALAAALSNISFTTAAAAPAGDCITIAYFDASQGSSSSNKPDNAGKYLYGYTNSAKTEAYAYTITTGSTNNKGQGTGASDYLRVDYGSTINIYADNTTTGGTPANFSNVTSVSVDFKMNKSSYYTTFDIFVGSTKIANNVSLEGAAQSAFTTFTYNNLEQLNGKISIVNKGSGTTNFNFHIDNIQICTSSLPACTTPVLPTLTAKTVCEGGDADAAWNAAITNSGSLVSGETVAYSWVKKGSSTVLSSVATYQPTDVTEAMAGTYVVTATVSADGKASKSASAEVDLTVTPATETPSITASKAKVYATDEVTLTATCGSTGVTWNWYLCANADGTGAGSSLGTSATYTIASAPAAGTYYYKAVATGDGTHSCGTAEYVYTLVVSTADACDKEFWFAKEGDRPTGAAAATHITGCPSGSSSASYTASIDGTNYTLTGSTGQKTGNVTIVVPADNTGTLYVVVQGSSSRTITLSKGGVQVGQETPANSTWGVFTFDNLDAGTYTLVSSGNISWAMMALKLCPTVACTDDTPTAAATNATVCAGGSITITATGYETGATFQWQKQNASTSVWENIDGATSDTYTVATAAAEHAGNYHIVANKTCARTSNTVTIAVPSAPVFNSFTTTRRVMETQALSISDVSATDAVSYTWYKSADATWDAGDEEIGDTRSLLKPYAGETAGSTYYVICRAANSCGTTTSSAITVNVQTLVEEDCAIVGNSGEHNTFAKTGSVSSGTYGSITELHTNSNNKYIYYTAESGYYFATATVNACVGNASDLPTAAYSYSTDGGANWTDQNLTGMTAAYADHVINLPANVNAFRVGRRLGDCGISSSTIYIHEVCFTYNESCTKTTVDPSSSTVSYTIGDSFTEPTFTVKSSGVALSPQPTITYTSSDETVATVDDDGSVNFQDKAGTVVITASYAGDATYCSSEGSYTITVSCSDEAPKVVAADGTNLGGCNSSITLEAKKTSDESAFTGGTYQWYRDGEPISGATSASYTAAQTGVYTVERTSVGGCVSPSSNKATITSTSAEPEVERLTPFQYYHLDSVYRETSIMRFRNLFAVKNAGTTLEGKHFKMELSRNGGAATDVTNSNAFVMNADTVLMDMNKLYGKYEEDDELVLTCSAVDCSHEVSSIYKNTITIYVINKNTPTLALICSGANGDGTRKTSDLVVGGDFLTGYNKADLCVQTGKTSFDKTQEWVLYTRLKENYIVTPVNGYAEFNKLNYEPFDILFLTDYPKASKSDAAATILDDMADLCDYRPLFTFKTHMVHKSPSKWAAKGFMAEPKVPEQSRLRLNIVCYAHPMFDDLKTTSTYIQKDASDHSQIVYTMLSGPGHESSKGMQGFPIDAAEGFVTIGLVHNDATAADNTPSAGYVTWTPGSKDVMLVAAAERQVNLEARMILFSINCGAQSKLTETGRQVVLKSLEYLLSDATIKPVADCSFTFTNGAGNSMSASEYASKCPACTGTIGDGKWSTAGNWGPDWILQPGKDTEVKIAAPVTVDMPHAKVRTVRILEGGSIDIPAGSGLEVGSTIRRLDGTEISPTEVVDLSIGSTIDGNGTLIFNNNAGDTKAGVAMYSKGFIDYTDPSKPKGIKNYQYIGVPFTAVNALYNYYGSWLYSWSDKGSGYGWQKVPNGGTVTAWTGYCITQETATTHWSTGTLAATNTVDIDVPAGENMVVGNSWTAPIYIKEFTDDDFENLLGNVYFFNTGVDKSGDAGTAETRYQNSTYVTVPIHSSPYTGDSLISSMQGFFVKSDGSAGALHLDYDRHVRPSTNRNILSGQMHAPVRRANAQSDEPTVLKIKVSGENYDDRLLLLEREDFTTGLDNGWDGDKWDGNESALYIYTKDSEGTENSVSAIPELEGTVIGFRAGEDEAYTLHFEYLNSEEPLYLYDVETNMYTQLMTGTTYRFFTTDNEKHDRFVITRKNPQVATGVGEVPSDQVQGTRARKLLIEDKMFIMVNGMLYDATGKVVK